MRKPKPLDPQRFELAVKCLALHRAKTVIAFNNRKVIDRIAALLSRARNAQLIHNPYSSRIAWPHCG